jgi:pilus assembly protein CpaB
MRSKIILLLAIIMGVITTYLFFNYMKQFDTVATVNENMDNVVVAKQGIKKNQQVTSAMVQVVQVPSKGIHPQAIKSLSELEEGYATSDIVAGEPILQHRIQKESEEKLLVSRKVKKDYRAVSVGVNFVQSVSNLIDPEDYVDVVFSEKIKVGAEEEIKTKLILSKVRVLAVGMKMVEKTPEEVYVEYSSATLELKSADAVTLINASERGTIQLILHSRVLPPKGGTENDKKSK